ncbi:uncharacterized protein SCHCODRAFT_01206450 [Schizophyllum commune H4-8]|uniref:Uncharacterized protein n=1 Tax=Schizophyllum commune (strain H4-8 / FGSC 9210) TaxID=578458 RepID=D8QK58_SCHCM|nr:uncharacterized protein SCHCODRAFT_01206450 [Schizophyllum commune H4-8]KAI5885721.1 hypothetical protein SCHCODRAFT_01206450 [Schizophyllum commune H4-8]
MSASADNTASALRIAGILGAQLVPALQAIQGAKDVTLACGCGSMAEGYANPCRQPVCTVCVKDLCPNCAAQYTSPNPRCGHHRGPFCPHKNCPNGNVVEYYRANPPNGAELFKAVSEHGAHIQELVDHLIVLTRDL